MKTKNYVAFDKTTLEDYPNVKASPFTVFDFGTNETQTLVVAVAADGNSVITNNKNCFGVDFDDACKNLISNLENKLGKDFKINEF